MPKRLAKFDKIQLANLGQLWFSVFITRKSRTAVCNFIVAREHTIACAGFSLRTLLLLGFEDSFENKYPTNNILLLFI